jgi:hypothetical protein
MRIKALSSLIWDSRNGLVVSSLPWLPTARDASNHPIPRRPLVTVSHAVRPIGRVPLQPLDAPENLPKEVARQVVLGQLGDEVPRMLDQATARLEEPLSPEAGVKGVAAAVMWFGVCSVVAITRHERVSGVR